MARDRRVILHRDREVSIRTPKGWVRMHELAAAITAGLGRDRYRVARHILGVRPEEVTTRDLRALRDEASEVGDEGLARICERALDGSARARRTAAQIMTEARVASWEPPWKP